MVLYILHTLKGEFTNYTLNPSNGVLIVMMIIHSFIHSTLHNEKQFGMLHKNKYVELKFSKKVTYENII